MRRFLYASTGSPQAQTIIEYNLRIFCTDSKGFVVGSNATLRWRFVDAKSLLPNRSSGTKVVIMSGKRYFGIEK